MEYHRNKATTQRPGGDRVLDAPYVFIDTPLVQATLAAEKDERKDKTGYTVFKSDELAVVLIHLKSGARITPGKTNGTLVFQVLEGQVEVTVVEQQIPLAASQMLIIHPHFNCDIVALQETKLFLYNAILR